MTTKHRDAGYPLFSLYTTDELSRRLGLTKRYLCDLEEGNKPIGRRFRAVACGILSRTEEELFGPDDDAGTADETPVANEREA